MMTNQNIYKDIAERTDGEIFIGVVGPVRSGKSTFIRRFMEEIVLPEIKNEHDRARASDELPQSAGGRTVMTTEPKFVPDEAVEVGFGEGVSARVRLIDCVGYLIPGILGDTENGEARLVSTPWSDTPIPFDNAAETGTRKVITEHSTIGLMITSDGSFGDLPRENYVASEERVVSEMQKTGKPFVIILNSADPAGEASEALALELEKKYSAPVALLNCKELNRDDIEGVMHLAVSEFPMREISVTFPEWISALEKGHPIRTALCESVKACAKGICKASDLKKFKNKLSAEITEKLGKCDCPVSSIDMGSGDAAFSVSLAPELLYKTITKATGIEIANEADLLTNIISLSKAKREYDRFAEAIEDVNEKGYGIVMPDVADMTLAEPEIIRQAGGYGVRLRAVAPSIHMIKASIETELNPIVGTEEQSEALVRSLLADFEDDRGEIWNTNLFGKSIYELVNDGIHAKLNHIPDDARDRLGETLSRVINEGASGLVCILL